MTLEMTAPGSELYCPTCEQHFVVGEVCPDDGTRLVRLGAQNDPFLGRDLDGRYKILDKLGQGGMGAVYRARQHSMGREVAVKVVNIGADAASIKRFLREAKVVSRLTHPNVVAVLDFGQTPDGQFYLVMELVQGRTLHDALATEGRLALPRIVRIAAQICDALEGAHRVPIVHRDLKPANIMLLAAGRDLVKVLDFGLAKSLAIDTSITMTSAGALLGTPTFMPPEIANGAPFIDGRADLYSLGCILYAMGTGRPPFVSDSIIELISMHGTTPAPPMTGVPAPLARVVDRLLLKDPAARYQTAAETRDAIEAAFEAIRTHGMFEETAEIEIDKEIAPVAPSALTVDSVMPRRAPQEDSPPERPSERSTTSVFVGVQLGSLEPSAPPLPPAPERPVEHGAQLATAGASGAVESAWPRPGSFAPAVLSAPAIERLPPQRIRARTMVAILGALVAVGVVVGLMVAGGAAPERGSDFSGSEALGSASRDQADAGSAAPVTPPSEPTQATPGSAATTTTATGSGSATVTTAVPAVRSKTTARQVADKLPRARPPASSGSGAGSATGKDGSAIDRGEKSPF